ncbi:hypothetical protein ACUH93_00545 [Dermabacteraceae bacterium P7006]
MWEIQDDLVTSQERTLLSEYAGGVYGNGPFVWFSAQAVHGNALPPGWTDLPLQDGVVDAGLWKVGERYAKSVKATEPVDFGWRLPFPAGHPIMFGVDLDGTMEITYHDQGGAQVGRYRMTGTGERVEAALAPSSTAVTLGIALTVGARIARPQVVFQDSLPAYLPGQGCMNAVVEIPSWSVSTIAPTLYSDTTYRVMEVG